MSQENVQIVRHGYELLESRDIEAWIGLFDADVEAHDLAGIPDEPIRRGHDALREWVAMMEEIWVDPRYEPEEFIEAGEFIVVAVRATARGRWKWRAVGYPHLPSIRGAGRENPTPVGLPRPRRSPRSRWAPE